jgi:hypothetical protein
VEDKPVKIILNAELRVFRGVRHGKCLPLKGKVKVAMPTFAQL